VLVEARLDVNVALNRPSYQVNTYMAFGKELNASQANDGDHDTNYINCAHTEYSINPWWAVDLRAALYVDAVQFTNRGVDMGTSL